MATKKGAPVLEILKMELELTQRQVDKYDQISASTKTWAITLWAASSSWAFQTRSKEVALFGMLVALLFWTFDGMNKRFRQYYKARRTKVGELLGLLFQGKALPPGTVAPLLPEYKQSLFVKYMFLPHIALPYLLLIAISIAIYVRF